MTWLKHAEQKHQLAQEQREQQEKKRQQEFQHRQLEFWKLHQSQFRTMLEDVGKAWKKDSPKGFFPRRKNYFEITSNLNHIPYLYMELWYGFHNKGGYNIEDQRSCGSISIQIYADGFPIYRDDDQIGVAHFRLNYRAGSGNPSDGPLFKDANSLQAHLAELWATRAFIGTGLGNHTISSSAV